MGDIYMKKIKVGMFVDNFFPKIDGVVMVVDNYAKKLMQYGEVVVICPSYGDDDDSIHPYRVIRTKSLKVPIIGYNLATPKIDSKLNETLKEEIFDIIHVHSPFSIGSLGINFATTENIPVVATLHSQFKQDFLRYFHNDAIATKITKKVINIYNKCDECYTVNEKMCEIFKDYGYLSEPIVIPNATDFYLIDNPSEAIENVNKKYNLNSNDIVLLFVGRINVLKNILFIAESLNILKKYINFKMLFVGIGPDLDLLREKINEYNLNDYVIFCEEVKQRCDLRDIYMRSKLFIFPSLYDTNSLVQIEAASQKKPTIFINGAITASLIKDNINGFIAPNDAMLFAKRILNIIKDELLYNRVCENAYNDIYTTYDETTKKLYKRYTNLISKENR